MTDIRTRAFAGIVGLAVAGLLSVGCSSSSGGTGTGGTGGSAGTTGSAGTSGGGGTGGAAACVPPTAALITDFGTTSTSQVGTIYKGADTGLTAPTTDTSSGALVINIDTGVPSTMYPFAYVGLPLNSCTDATSYTGVKFNISGTLNSACTIQFSAVDKEHSTVADNGTCTASSCYPSSKIFTLSSTPTDVMVLFTDQTGGGANAGAATLDATELLNVQWQFNVPTADGSGGCVGMVTIDNVSFF